MTERRIFDIPLTEFEERIRDAFLQGYDDGVSSLSERIAEAVQAEREACAKVAEQDVQCIASSISYRAGYAAAAEDIAAAIRARGEMDDD